MKLSQVLIGLFLLSSTIGAASQNPAGSSNVAHQTRKPKPDFTLTISTEDKTVKAQKDMDIFVSIKEKNISRHIVNATKPQDPGKWYTMRVLLDGHPAPITQRYREILDPKPVKVGPNVMEAGSDGFPFTINPGKSKTFEITLDAFFDLNTPGKYEITFSRGTDSGQPYNVDVKSNTITITVLPPDDPAPVQH